MATVHERLAALEEAMTANSGGSNADTSDFAALADRVAAIESDLGAAKADDKPKDPLADLNPNA